MDAFRTPSAALADVLDSLSGEYVTLADTVGAATPMEVESFLTALSDEECDLSTLAVHFHDDFGLATANTLTAAQSGIGAADVSIHGIGERAGNAPLEEVVAARVLAEDAVGIEYEELVPICRSVADTLGEPVAEDKALLGSRATTHEAGIHTAAMLADPGTFEPFDPERFGGERSLVVGKGSGRRTIAAMFEAVGETVTDERIEAVLQRLDDDRRLSVDEAEKTVRAVVEAVQV
jgi:isopropylmalate/homocitrate/citramalate synthase